MTDSFSKKEREKKKKKKKERKAEKKAQRKAEDGNSTDEFLYVDEFGNFSDTPPDESKKEEIDPEDIVVGVPKKSEYDSDLDGDLVKGQVKFFDQTKQFGFIVEKGSKKEYFVHGDNVEGDLRDNDKVVFETEDGPKGPVAVNVKIV